MRSDPSQKQGSRGTDSDCRPRIAHIAYVLGEITATIADRPVAELLRAGFESIEELDAVSGRSFHRTERDLIALGVASALQSLASSEVDRDDIGLVIFCSTIFDHVGYGDADKAYRKLLTDLRLERAHVIGVTLNNCTGLLSALSLANALILARSQTAVLVIASDKVRNETFRLTDYALFSDGAASCILSRTTGPGLIIRAETFGSNCALTETQDLFSDLALYKTLGRQLLDHASVAPDRIGMIFSSNMFAPLARVKECAYGARDEQVYLDNIWRIGHCFSADPLINISDFESRGGLVQGDPYVLASNAPGLRAALLVTADRP